MKEIFSSFFRTIGRFFAYIFLGFLLSLILNGCDVFAATSTGYASTDFSLYYIDNTSHGTKCSTKINYDDFSTDNSGSWSGWTDIDNTLGSYNDLTGVGSLIGRVSFRVYGSSSYIYKAGNSYTVRLTVDFDNSINADNFIKYYKLQYYRGNTSASQTGNTIEVFDSVFSRMIKGSEDYRVLIYITFTPNQDLKFLRFDFVQKNLSLTDKTQYVNECDLLISSIEYEYLKITYVEGSNALIQEQTAMIEEKFNSFMSIFQKNNDEIKDIYTNDTENEDGTCDGIICNIKKIVRSVLDLPSNIINGLRDILLSLFVPTTEQVNEIIELSKELSENFGFIGQSFDFFINVFTDLLSLADSDGCVDVPAFELGKTTLTPKIVFWNETQYCLADNEILADNIVLIQIMTSIILVAMFVGFGASKFFSILSKNDSEFVKENYR